MKLINRLKTSFSFRKRGLKHKILTIQSHKVRDKAEKLLRSSELRLSKSIPFTIACLIGKRQLVDLLFSLLSFERSVKSIGKLTILSDGSLDSQDVQFFQKWHKNSQVFLSIDELCEAYQHPITENLSRFYRSYCLALKLLLINAVQSQSSCLLLDSDVIFFQNPLNPSSEISHAISNQIPVCLEDEIESFDPDIWDNEISKNRIFSKKVNSGLVYLPKGSFDKIDWEDRIPEIAIQKPNIFAEQSIISSGLEQIQYSFLPKSKYLVSLQGTGFPKGNYPPFNDIDISYESLVCRHFITPVRYLMWLKAFPLLENKLKL